MHYFSAFQIFFSWEIIFSLSNYPFNDNIANLESKIIYFYLRSNLHGRTTLKLTGNSTFNPLLTNVAAQTISYFYSIKYSIIK